jgi:Ser/Thr protein kinase RdoA (MazF antagonist)
MTRAIQPFELLTMRGQLGRLRRLGEEALRAYDLTPSRLVPLAHEENTSFLAIDGRGDRYVLRIHRVSGTPFHPPRTVAEVRSETAWLSTIRRETDLVVPEPVAAANGSLLTVAEADGVPGSRTCVLFRWHPGRFLDGGLTSTHLERVGRFMARLHEHALHFEPALDFQRWRIGDTTGAVATYIAATVGAAFGPRGRGIAEDVIASTQRVQRELGTDREVYGLIHADLHQDNYFFHQGQVRAIDFDDCGWGHFAYDLAVTLSEVRTRPDFVALQAALLRGYREARLFPVEHEPHLETFYRLRLLQLILWFIEQRNHPAFADWETEARNGLNELEMLAWTPSRDGPSQEAS